MFVISIYGVPLLLVGVIGSSMCQLSGVQMNEGGAENAEVNTSHLNVLCIVKWPTTAHFFRK